ncbi:MAG: hypothetical protein ACTSSK_14310, partial [Candidatus Heimdallarchaeota archaeon]
GSFEGFIQDSPARQITISVDAYDLSVEPVAGILRLKENTATAIENAEVGDRVQKVDWYLERGLFAVFKDRNSGRDMIALDHHIYGIPPDYFSALVDVLYNGSMIDGVGEFLVVAKTASLLRTNVSDYGRHAVFTPVFGADPQDVIDAGIPLGGQYINVTGSIAKEDFVSMNGTLADDFLAMADYFSDEFFLIIFQTNFS